jgi:hypothetical protein
MKSNVSSSRRVERMVLLHKRPLDLCDPMAKLGGGGGPRAALSTGESRLPGRMDRILAALSRPLRIAVLGEPGSGKTSVINHLLDAEALPLRHPGAGQLPVLVRFAAQFSAFTVSGKGGRGRLTTRAIRSAEPEPEEERPPVPKIVYQQLRRSEFRDQEASAPVGTPNLRGEPGGNYVEIALPNPALRDVEFVEIPSLLNGWCQVASMASLIRSADAAIWCTVAHQAWKESERRNWLRCRGRFGDRTLLAVTFADALAVRGQRDMLAQRLNKEAGEFFPAGAFASLKAHAASPPETAPAHGQAAHGTDDFPLREGVQALLDRIAASRFERAQRIALRLATPEEERIAAL